MRQPPRGLFSFYMKGTISITPAGVGYLTVSEGDDIQIPAGFLNTALHGDEVEISLFPQIPGERQQGEVTKIVKRKKTRFVGTVEKKGRGFAFLRPDDRHVYTDIFVSQTKNIKSGYKVLVELKEWEDPQRNPEGKIIEVFGPSGDNEVEMRSIMAERGLPRSFPKKFEDEARKMANLPVNTAGRRDLRSLPVFTIDPWNAKDFDDALSLERVDKDIYRVGVHIADVSYYVRENSLLDTEARERAFSLYLVDRTVPMLPEALSNRACSLNPNEDKMAFTVLLTLDKKVQLQKVWMGRSVIRSQKRFSYEEAQEVLDNNEGPFLDDLIVLRDLSREMIEKRQERGAIEFDQTELDFHLDKQGRPVQIEIKQRQEVHRLIEEFMILANRQVAQYLGGSVCLYRVHGEPDKKALSDLVNFVSPLGYNLKKNPTSKDINKLLSTVKDEPEEFLIQSVVLRSLSKACYSTKNIGHFGLALKHYCHFTSPIRRYADLIIHRLLLKKLKNKPEKDKKSYQEIAEEISKRELDILSAERASIAHKQVEYMLARQGQTCEGIISGVTAWGLYVQELETKAEGMIRIQNIKDDYYIFNAKRFCLIGQKKKKKYALGDKVKIKVMGGDIDHKTLEYNLVK